MTLRVRTRIRQALRSAGFRRALRPVLGAAVLVGVIGQVGTGPFLRGILSLDGPTIGAALLLAAVATVAASWRWQLIATRLGVPLRLSTAVGMYYQSQFLNTILPGGIVGDIRRAVDSGPSGTSVRPAARAVAVERVSGQVVQLALALVVLACFGTEFEGYLLPALGIGFGIVVAGLAAAIALSARARAVLLSEAHELRAGLGSLRTSLQVALASVIVVGCHVATLTLATLAVGERMSGVRMITLALVILLGASIPLNIGGWGPREGIAGWAFALAGVGAPAGVAASTLFGVLTILSIAPGALVAAAVAARLRRPESILVPHALDHALDHEETP
ncbi:MULTISPECIES: lysylphosphatidylglycerol synthase transmembrane domain-containing protein [unclassified Cryobacterium]|uniref:lysylphosphatidylglycerol synthase transmembrane domain-containing protein n=1 Tax=unclassified Cryobacterium TaxID=2649013 RepID=UPI002AB47D5D|nr:MULTISPECIES: lysylphosphatidylglycerol synthase transmembrane domain-containing protein [unclassified Cryobacterium]MDY7544003.1 lysylphosphatidylglycerol synthase transmembrane domain-containing protein [Cryobacterium sp. 5B3]MEA9997733.1 lysylphosphatidylglycerol synthase transmembrane domain-containing protein [Cryobacterium sp. RTS3]MEB0265839.1 lysylphosphatidylglycerol synthase transmembrane domain-containing protein [Cryobacterium sp. 10I5]MEB0273190.1 lysylphosphatidylglycerol synth